MTFCELLIGRAGEFIEGESRNDWAPIICPKEPDHQRAGRRVTNLFLDVLSRHVVDFSRTMLSDVVITDHALEVFRMADLTGFIVRPVKIEAIDAGIESSTLPNL